MSAVDTTEREELAELLAATSRHDQRAFAELYRRTSSRLFGVCMRMLRDRSDAEEVLQEVFTTVWRRAESFDPSKASATTWLVTMARNRSIDRLRQHRESTMDDTMMLDLADEGPGPAANTQSSQERKRLERCLDGLEPQQKSAIREAFFSGATYNDLAARCRVPLGTMKSWIRRSLIRLRICLEQ
ncbi:sigma-70 family RNA polymerase sigma factor [Dyella sp.]|jgi:RNA polymerase sigma-70 factor (ECF subfamily)|uniref:sigma-70 family RNA polymerase sigma factor n=1 Tax=Dyella sp. TaxID=1869338 RepID=UPI002D78BEBE|nr:sigma-70 family RNA polymerase sigma factor [Dyella sp.]HET6433486.1 sigma-70 family RNA polymerase sigma factor [Dyella sp.]